MPRQGLGGVRHAHLHVSFVPRGKLHCFSRAQRFFFGRGLCHKNKNSILGRAPNSCVASFGAFGPKGAQRGLRLLAANRRPYSRVVSFQRAQILWWFLSSYLIPSEPKMEYWRVKSEAILALASARCPSPHSMAGQSVIHCAPSSIWGILWNSISFHDFQKQKIRNSGKFI